MNKNIPIFLASNDKYAPFVATTIASVCYNTKSFCDFYILDSGISNLNKKRIELLKEKFTNFSIEYLNIDINQFNGFQLLKHISLDTYSRFFIPILKQELNKVIYMDVDMIALGDIQELYAINLQNSYLGAVPEYYVLDCQQIIANNLNINYNNKKFFNAGILLINSKKWRENNITEKLFDIQAKYNNNLINGDQDILIKQFYEDYLELDFKFNLLSGQIAYKKQDSKEIEENIENAIKNPIIRHFETANKPWLINKNAYNNNVLNNFNEFWFFAKMTDFYDNLFMNFMVLNNNNNINCNNNNIKIKKYVKLFGIIPLLKIIEKNNKMTVKLFHFLPIVKINKK